MGKNKIGRKVKKRNNGKRWKSENKDKYSRLVGKSESRHAVLDRWRRSPPLHHPKKADV